ncbi:MAG TPA: hypothetical protein DDW30_02240 [Clostridiales bacterium]|nr:hypothetical protein [Clostridiales bacterium]
MTASGLSMAAMYCVVDLGSIVYSRAVNGLGKLYITAQTSSRKLIEMCMMPFESLSSANSTFVSQNYGAKKFDRIRKCIKSVSLLEVIYGALMFVVIFFFGGEIVKLLTNTSDALVIANATLSMNIHFGCYPALGILLELRTTMQALKYKTIPIISSLIEFVGKIVSGFALIPIFGYTAVCLTEPALWILMAAFLLIAFAVVKPIKKAEIYERGEQNNIEIKI